MKRVDPWPYDGPIERADGIRPYNHYLWPTESWWPNREAKFKTVSPRHNFGIVHLKDGRFSTEGAVYYIEKNRGIYDLPCVFETRLAAIRIAAARAIQLARASSKFPYGQALIGQQLADVINWYRSVVASESGKPEPRPVKVSEPPAPPPVRPEDGLPLFEFKHNKEITEQTATQDPVHPVHPVKKNPHQCPSVSISG
jgi:hypothetical protein